MRDFTTITCGLLITVAFLISASLQAQKKAVKPSFRDSIDGAFDMSRFLIEMNGFIPFPIVLTEPALGGIGGGLAMVFIKTKPPHIDTVRGKARVMRTQPDVYGAGGLYTANESWAALAFISGSWVKHRLKYRAGSGFANINLSFYRAINSEPEREFEFNLQTIPFIGSLLKEIKGTYWSGGIQYTFLRTQLKALTAKSDFVREKEFLSMISMPGVVLDFDNRDNMFTPNRGFRGRASYSMSHEAFGSDYNYSSVNVFGYAYHPLMTNLVGAVRFEMQQVFDDPPFYMLPYINLRGLPLARYQANIFSVGETEFRWDVIKRWSLVGFVGTGKAYETWNDFSNTKWTTSGGGGFRYLAARAFNLRVGIDVAKGPEQWAYYFVLGNAWLR